MAFRDIQGQDRAVGFLRNSINKKRMAQVYLFSGPRGVGKTLTARSLAKMLNCEAPVIAADARTDCCDLCLSCRKIDNANHPDVHWISGGEGGEKISIDDIRALQKKIYLKNLEGKWRVFIILEAQEMTAQAANSLLKSMEELPPFCLLILTSADMAGLLNTVVSRCQIVRFAAFERGSLEKILVEKYSVAPADAHFLALFSEGRLGRALELKEENALGVKNRLIEQLSGGRFKPDSGMFNIKDKKELTAQLGFFLNWFRDILAVKAGMSEIINNDQMERISECSRRWEYSRLETVINKIDETYRLLDQNINVRIAVEAMMIEVQNAGSSLS